MEKLETLPSSGEPKILKDTPLKTKMEPENGPLKRRFIIFKGDLRAYISQTTYTPKTNMFPKKGSFSKERDCLPTSIFQGTFVHFRGGGQHRNRCSPAVFFTGKFVPFWCSGRHLLPTLWLFGKKWDGWITKHFRYLSNGGIITYVSCMDRALCKGITLPPQKNSPT